MKHWPILLLFVLNMAIAEERTLQFTLPVPGQVTWEAAKDDLIPKVSEVPEVSETDSYAEEGAGEAIDFICETAPSCQYQDKATNLRLQVPQGWALSYPFFYETPGGTKADKATVSFIRLRDGVMVSLNQPQAGGQCLETRSGSLCYFIENNIDKQAVDIIIQGADAARN